MMAVLVTVSCTIAGPVTYDGYRSTSLKVPLPKAYAVYQLLPGSMSPDGKFGMIFPKRDVLFDMFDKGTARLILVRLAPFSELVDIPLGYSTLTGNANCHYTISWTKDSQAFLMIQGTKWGADRVYLGELDEERRAKLTDLAEKVAAIVRPDFKKSGAPPYNDTFQYVFDYEDRFSKSDTGGWKFMKSGNVKIDCTCTTDPKGIEKNHWTVAWMGVWNRRKQQFEKTTLTRK